MSSSSDDLFTIKAPACGLDSDDEVEVQRAPAPRVRQGGKRQRAIVIGESDEDERATAPSTRPEEPATREAPVARRGAGKQPAADDEAWLRPPSRPVNQGATGLTEAEQALLRRNAQVLAELNRPVELDREEVIVQQTAPPPPPTALPSFSILLRLRDNPPKKFKVKANTSFATVFEAFFQNNLELDRRKTTFKFDGDRVVATQTPGALGMEDDDVIDVS